MVKLKHNREPLPHDAPRVLSRDVDCNTRYWLEGSPDLHWRAARVLHISPHGADVELFATTPTEAATHRVVIEFEVPPTVLRLRGAVRNLGLGSEGGVRVGLQFAALSVLERDMLDLLFDQDFAALPMHRRSS